MTNTRQANIYPCQETHFDIKLVFQFISNEVKLPLLSQLYLFERVPHEKTLAEIINCNKLVFSGIIIIIYFLLCFPSIIIDLLAYVIAEGMPERLL